MDNKIVKQDVQTLVDGWLRAEENGETFPVDFDVAWAIAGYSTKGNAKRKLTGSSSKLTENQDFAFINSDKWSQGGRSSDYIKMSCDGFKQFCLMANTDEGTATRLYFIDIEKKWRLARQVAPQFTQEIEVLHLKIELAKQEAIKSASEERVLSIRQYVVQSCPEPVQQKILGYTEIKVVETRDRLLQGNDLIRDGSTINKTEMCRRLNFITKNGAPDYKKLNKFLESADIPGEAWKLVASLRENEELDLIHWQEIERKWMNSDRNLYLGE